MEFDYAINETITIRQKVYCQFIDTTIGNGFDSYPQNAWLDSGMSICIHGRWFDVIPKGTAYRTRNEDEYYRFIYIQINYKTGEYYIGKVNRKSLHELKKYQGSGVKFHNKYEKHADEFQRYYIAHCLTAKETERLESEIVDEELLKDPFCLNLVKGGGGTNVHYDYDRSQKQSEYMKAHPERYEALVKAAREFASDPDAVRRRSEKTKQTMSSVKYKDMSRDRIINWKETCPDEYKEARENNKASNRKEESRKKKSESEKAFRRNNPDEYQKNEEKRKRAANSPEARVKRSESLKKWISEHPEEVKARAQKISIKNQKAINMLDLNTGEVLKTFASLNEAAEWLVINGYAKNTNCKASISSVCLHKPCTTGYGYRKKAYGFRWEYVKG